MNRKSVLLVGNYPPPFGGVPRHLECLAPHLIDKGWEVQVLSGGRSGVEHHNGLTVYKTRHGGRLSALAASSFPLLRRTTFPHQSLIWRSPRRWVSYMAHAAVGRRIIAATKPCLISAYNLVSNGPVGALLSEEHGIPLVVSNFGEIHSMTDFCRTHLSVIHHVTQVARLLLSCSRHCADSYALLGLSPTVRVVPYGVDLRRFSPAEDGAAMRRTLGLPEANQVVLFVGRMIRDMGLHTLLDAIPHVLRLRPNVTFVIAGGRGELLPRARSMEGRPAVLVVPDVPFADLPRYYAAASIVAVPTLGDRACSSLAAMEAMATGKPVVATAVGGIPELVRDGETGFLVNADDPAALGPGLVHALQDEALLARMGRAGRRVVEDGFDQDRTNDMVERLFQEIARP